MASPEFSFKARVEPKKLLAKVQKQSRAQYNSTQTHCCTEHLLSTAIHLLRIKNDVSRGFKTCTHTGSDRWRGQP
jgi:hypothetical protein